MQTRIVLLLLVFVATACNRPQPMPGAAAPSTTTVTQPPPPVACTLIGCGDSFRIHIPLDADKKAGYEVAIDVDGQSATCQRDVSQLNAVCGSVATWAITEGSTCTTERIDVDGVAVLKNSCVGNGSFSQVIAVDFAPRQVRVTLTRDTFQATRVFQPEYAESRPNGPLCEPVCKSANLEWRP